MEALPWYIAGPLLGLMVPALLILREKQLGISSSFRVIGAHLFPKWDYFRYDWKKDTWQIHFSIGLLVAAFLLFGVTDVGTPIIDDSSDFGAQALTIYDRSNVFLFFFGAVAIGFGARYADGCTAGHCIMGNSQLAPSALLTTVFFFIGGLISTYLILPNLIAS